MIVIYSIQDFFHFINITLVCNLLNNHNYKSSKDILFYYNKSINEFKLSALLLLLYYCAVVLVCCYITFPGFFHQCPYSIYQTILFVSFSRYSDLLIMKELMNSDHLPRCAIVPLNCYVMLPSFFHSR